MSFDFDRTAWHSYPKLNKQKHVENQPFLEDFPFPHGFSTSFSGSQPGTGTMTARALLSVTPSSSRLDRAVLGERDRAMGFFHGFLGFSDRTILTQRKMGNSSTSKAIVSLYSHVFSIILLTCSTWMENESTKPWFP